MNFRKTATYVISTLVIALASGCKSPQVNKDTGQQNMPPSSSSYATLGDKVRESKNTGRQNTPPSPSSYATLGYNVRERIFEAGTCAPYREIRVSNAREEPLATFDVGPNGIVDVYETSKRLPNGKRLTEIWNRNPEDKYQKLGALKFGYDKGFIIIEEVEINGKTYKGKEMWAAYVRLDRLKMNKIEESRTKVCQD